MQPERVGHFQILEPIASGGMGAVYRARDERLGREVAVKLLLERSGVSEAARERMLREARAVAALNHPHICTLFEAGEHDGQPYLVMELLTGETLHARLAHGAIAWEQAVAWAIEVADALQAAHARGILHRDLKPGNIFLTAKAGTKVLDFGLARMDDAWAAAAAAEAPTMAAAPEAIPEPLTERGTILGTLAYMPPEQARGEAADVRSDIYSLGVVLYEMVTGARPFHGRTAADLTATILREPAPAPSSVRPGIPPRLDDVIAQCLEKDPEFRFQTAADLRAALRRLRASASSVASAAPPSSSAVSPPVAAPPPSSDSALARGLLARHRRAAAVTAAVVVAIIAGLVYSVLRQPAAPSASGWDHVRVDQLTNLGDVSRVALSPDGYRLAYTRADTPGAPGSLWLRDLRSGTSVELLKPDPKATIGQPQFSPDGTWIYFNSHISGTPGMSLVRVSALGGVRQLLASPDATSMFALSPDGGSIAYVKDGANGATHLVAAASDGSGARDIASMSPPDQIVGYPAWSPRGNRIAYVARSPGVGPHVMIAPAQGGPARRLGSYRPGRAGGLTWLPDGGGVLVTGGVIAQVSLLRLPAGARQQVTSGTTSFYYLSVSRAGPVAAVQAQHIGGVWVSPPGNYGVLTPVGSTTQQSPDVRGWLADGSITFIQLADGAMQQWSMAPDGSSQAQLTHSASSTGGVATLDGRHLLLESARGHGVTLANASGGGTRLLFPDRRALGLVAVGSKFVVVSPPAHPAELERLPLSGGTPQPFVLPGFKPNGNLAISFNGDWIAADIHTPAGDRTGVFHFGTHPGGPPVATLPVMAGFQWMPDNKTLAFQRGRQLWAQPVAGGLPHQLTHFSDGLEIESWALSPTGRLAIARDAVVRDAVILRPGH